LAWRLIALPAGLGALADQGGPHKRNGTYPLDTSRTLANRLGSWYITYRFAPLTLFSARNRGDEADGFSRKGLPVGVPPALVPGRRMQAAGAEVRKKNLIPPRGVTFKQGKRKPKLSEWEHHVGLMHDYGHDHVPAVPSFARCESAMTCFAMSCCPKHRAELGGRESRGTRP
jgi:hypothetical protein